MEDQIFVWTVLQNRHDQKTARNRNFTKCDNLVNQILLLSKNRNDIYRSCSARFCDCSTSFRLAETFKEMPPKRKVNGYEMPEPIPAGEVLVDLQKRRWRIGPSIGKGGFGEIYSAQDAGSSGKTYPYVVKIEPHANGPLFVEMHFYSRNAKEADIESFMTARKLKSLGMPAFIGNGSHEYKNKKYRFLVLEKFGSDIWKKYLSNDKKFPEGTVYKLALQMLNVLEYIHSKGYVHCDLKGANILLGLKNSNQAYLLDYGLAGRFSTDQVFKPDPKKMHNGTIEYLSRDAHQGVQTRRGDLEVLGYNLLHWLGCTLPWEKHLTNPKSVQESKEKHMADIPLFMKTCFGSLPIPDSISKFFNYIKTLKFNEEPDYKKIAKFFEDGLKSCGQTTNTGLAFNSPVKRKGTSTIVTKTTKRGRKKEIEEDEPSEETEGEMKPTRRGRSAKVSKELSLEETDEEEEVVKIPNQKDTPNSKARGRKKFTENVEESMEEDNVKKATKRGRQKKNAEINMNDSNEEIVRKSNRRKLATKKASKERKDTSDEEEINFEKSDAEEEDLIVKPEIQNGSVTKGRKKLKKSLSLENIAINISTKINKVSNSEENLAEGANGTVANKEMLRIKQLMEQRKNKRKPGKK